MNIADGMGGATRSRLKIAVAVVAATVSSCVPPTVDMRQHGWSVPLTVQSRQDSKQLMDTLPTCALCIPAMLACSLADDCTLSLVPSNFEPSPGGLMLVWKTLVVLVYRAAVCSAVVHRAALRSSAGGGLLTRGRIVKFGVCRVPRTQLRLLLPVRIAERQLHGARHHALAQARQQRLPPLHPHTAPGLPACEGRTSDALVQQSMGTLGHSDAVPGKKLLCCCFAPGALAPPRMAP